jgi:hypothetical protein
MTVRRPAAQAAGYGNEGRRRGLDQPGRGRAGGLRKANPPRQGAGRRLSGCHIVPLTRCNGSHRFRAESVV